MKLNKCSIGLLKRGYLTSVKMPFYFFNDESQGVSNKSRIEQCLLELVWNNTDDAIFTVGFDGQIRCLESGEMSF